MPVAQYVILAMSILAPKGYSLNEAEMRFTVDKDGNVTGDTVIRDDQTCFFLQKQDENGKPLPGVEFRLVDDTTGQIIETVTSNEKGEFIFTKFDIGEWFVS